MKQRKEYYTKTIVVVCRDYSDKVIYVLLRSNVTIWWPLFTAKLRVFFFFLR